MHDDTANVGGIENPPPPGPADAANVARLALNKLTDILVELFPDEESTRMVIDRAGLDHRNIGFDGRASVTWASVRAEAMRVHKLDAVITAAGEIYSSRHDELHALLTEFKKSAERARDPSGTDVPAIKVSLLGEINFAVALLLVAGAIVYYYRHYAELVGAGLAAFVGAGCLAALGALRAAAWAAMKKPVLERIGKLAANALGRKIVTVVLAAGMTGLVCLFLVTSSIVLTYDGNVSPKPLVTLIVKGDGKPFAMQRLSISAQHGVAGRVFHELFPTHDITYELETPPQWDVPSREPFAQWSRIRLHAPSSFNAPTLCLLTIVPGPELFSSLPGPNTVDPPKRYYLRIRTKRGQALLTSDYRKGTVLTGAELRYLPTKFDAEMSRELPARFNGVFGEKLEAESLALVEANVFRMPSDRFDADDNVTVEAGRIKQNGDQDDPIATTTVTIGPGNQFTFPEEKP